MGLEISVVFHFSVCKSQALHILVTSLPGVVPEKTTSYGGTGQMFGDALLESDESRINCTNVIDTFYQQEAIFREFTCMFACLISFLKLHCGSTVNHTT